MARNHPLFVTQQHGAIVTGTQMQHIQATQGGTEGKGGQAGDQVAVWGANPRQGMSVMNASPAEAAAALPAAVASLQRLTGAGAGGFFGGFGLSGVGLGGSDGTGYGAQQQQPAPGTLLLGAGAPFGPIIRAPGTGAQNMGTSPGGSYLQPPQLMPTNLGLIEGSNLKTEKKMSDAGSTSSSTAASSLAKQAELLGMSREQLKSVLVSGGFTEDILDDKNTERPQKDAKQTSNATGSSSREIPQNVKSRSEKAVIVNDTSNTLEANLSLQPTLSTSSIGPESKTEPKKTGNSESKAPSSSAETSDMSTANIRTGSTQRNHLSNISRGNGSNTTSSSSTQFQTRDNSTSTTTAKNEFESKMKMALDFHCAETASLLKRCMIMAGFNPTETEECDSTYLEFARRATAGETQRIERIRAKLNMNGDRNIPPLPTSKNTSKSSNRMRGNDSGTKDSGSGRSNLRQEGANVPAVNSFQSINQQKMSSQRGQKIIDDDTPSNGRYSHQREGKVHQVGIHRPMISHTPGGFMMDQKAGFYEGINSMGLTSAMWSSNYSRDGNGVIRQVANSDNEVHVRNF
mmetsp:Transcript_38665/g.58020  ORF Transcript_38665/g.58020 Transcript_38665/m.58020 type:complete len:573 (+) Transcript_38665:1008-2726(+)